MGPYLQKNFQTLKTFSEISHNPETTDNEMCIS